MQYIKAFSQTTGGNWSHTSPVNYPILVHFGHVIDARSVTRDYTIDDQNETMCE